MNLFFTMAGNYSRFGNFSLKLPKFLLPFDKSNIFSHILKNLKNKEIKNYYFILNKKDAYFFKFVEQQIKNLKIKNYKLIIIDKTNSQIETAIKGVNSLKNSINLNDPVGFMNIDTILKKRNLKNYLNKLRTNDLFIDIFNSSNKSYSYVLCNKKQQVFSIKEKIVISDYASSGFYIFKNLKFINILKKEKFSYFSELINYMIRQNYIATCNKITKYEETIVLGTPEQYIAEIQK